MIDPGNYLLDTQPVPVDSEPGRYSAYIPEAWKIFYMFGGTSMGFALRSVETHLGRDDLRPVGASAIFCSPVPCGPVESTVDVLRNGRTAAQAVSNVWVPGVDSPALRMQATFGMNHDSDLEFCGVEFPDVPPPLDCDPPPEERDPDDPFGDINFHEQTEWRPALPQRPWDPEVHARTGGVPEFASWTRLLESPRHADGSYDWSALCIPGDQLGGAVGRALGPDHDDDHFFILSLEISMHFVGQPVSDWILQDSSAWVARDGYASGSLMLWDEERNLVATATQTANLRPFSSRHRTENPSG